MVVKKQGCIARCNQSLHNGMPYYLESTTITSSYNRILNLDIKLAIRFKLRQNI